MAAAESKDTDALCANAGRPEAPVVNPTPVSAG